MKKYFLLLAVLLCNVFLLAREFWLQPDKFIYKRGETINIRFLTGENFEGENWKGNNSRIESLQFYFGGVRDRELSKALSEENGDSIQLAMLDEGTAMVTCGSSNFFQELTPAKFNEYLRKNDLTEALEYREQNNDTSDSGREYYQRSVKTILQIGEKTDKTYKQETDLPLDIIPEDHPYVITKDGNFKMKILFKGEPLSKTKVRVWHRLDNKLSQTEYRTDEEGKFKFFVTASGRWMVTAVKIKRLQNDSKADWQSYWGSLTWGYEK